MSYELGIVILVGVAVGSIWYWLVQVPRNRRERNAEHFRKFMERQDEEIRMNVESEKQRINTLLHERGYRGMVKPMKEQLRIDDLAAAATATRRETR
jgi:hypothetical protein